MFCSKCGGNVAQGATFCSNCGQSVPAAPPQQFAAPSAAPAIAQRYAAVAPPTAYAGFWIRFLAYLLDGFITGAVFILVIVPFFFLTAVGGQIREIHPGERLDETLVLLIIGIVSAAVVLGIVGGWIYHAYMESSSWQATLGKRMVGIIVTDVEGRRISFGRASGRFFGKILTGMIPLFIGWLLAAFTERKQALHDMISGCLVLRKS